jgi:hypothetical protein
MWSKTKMKKAWVALGASALAIVLVASTFDAAEARHRGGGWSGGGARFVGRSYSAPRFVARSSSFARVAPFRHHRHVRRVFVGAPLAYGAYYYGSGCSWLRYRALETGSRYWWSRYYDCINGYY